MNEQKDEAIEKNAELEKQNYLLKRSLEAKSTTLERKERNIDELMEKMQKLEMDFGEKVDEVNQYKKIIKKEQREKHERNSSQFNAGGYIITTTDSCLERIGESKRFGTFNHGDSVPTPPPQTKVDMNSEVIKSMMEIMSEMMRNFQDKCEDIKYQEDYINSLEKKISNIDNKQKIIIEDIQYQNSIINDNVLDFEDHKKLLEQVVKENNELQNEVRSIKFQDIPIIKQMVNMRSAISDKREPVPTGNTLASFSQITNLKESFGPENVDSNIGATYYQRHPIMNDAHLNIKQNVIETSCLDMESNVPKSDLGSDNGIIEKQSEINGFEHIKDAESFNNESSSESSNNEQSEESGVKLNADMDDSFKSHSILDLNKKRDIRLGSGAEQFSQSQAFGNRGKARGSQRFEELKIIKEFK